MTQAAQTRRPFPQIGEVFELIANSEFSERSMAQAIERESQWEWRFGRSFNPPSMGTSKRFKLVQLGAYRRVEDVEKELRQHGRVPSGVWLLAFIEIFGISDVNRIGVAEDGWRTTNPHDCSYTNCFPAVSRSGESYFEKDSYHCGEGLSDFLWLVEVENNK